MDDPNKSSSSSLTLPPGCRFYPSEHEIFQYYLRLKNSPTTSEEPDRFDIIPAIKLSNLSPFDLPDDKCFKFGYRGSKRHWYFFRKRAIGRGGRRRAGLGYWKRRGRARYIVGESGNVLGKRSVFVFYSVDGGVDVGDGVKDGLKTDWLMYEYDLVDNDKVFVLCRIFLKLLRKNYLMDDALRGAEGSATMVRHIGIQHDGDVISKIGEDDILCLGKNKTGLIGGSFQILPDSQLSNLVRSSELACDNSILGNALDAQLSKYILEEDYIELDDLI